MGGLDHSVIVQVKKQKGRAKKGDLLLFRDVLLDIPGQPKGVFVSEHGYQKGALEVAQAAGITAFEIREISSEASRDPITMTNLSIMIMTQKPDKSLRWNTRSFSQPSVTFDCRWMNCGWHNTRKPGLGIWGHLPPSSVAFDSSMPTATSAHLCKGWCRTVSASSEKQD